MKIYDMSWSVHSGYHVEQAAAVKGYTHYKSRYTAYHEPEEVRSWLASECIDHNPLIDSETYLAYRERKL